MRVAALYDIHGNLPALEAVLREVRDAGVGRLIVGGDVVPGPMPRESLSCLLELPIPVQFITGNCEAAVLGELDGAPTQLPEPLRDVMRWTARELRPGEERFLRSWPATLRIDVEGVGPVLFCHATPRDNNEIFTSASPDERLRAIFADVGASLVVCGHTHMQFDRTIGTTRIVNAGSVGMPFGEPGAHWVLLGPDVDLKRTAYDLAAAADRIRRTPYPQAEEFAARYVLSPPSEAEMLALFSKADAAR